jgi:ATP-dependent DNA helicase RecQ
LKTTPILIQLNSIAFIDTEIDPNTGKILDIGCIKDNGSQFHKSSIIELISFVKGTTFVCGHNILQHDLNYIGKPLEETGVLQTNVIDTLYLSPLLFPSKPYHRLVKDDKLQTDDLNNPLTDAIKARDLFHDEISAFEQIDETLKRIYYHLLHDKREFQGFFRFIKYKDTTRQIEDLIRTKFNNEFCYDVSLTTFISENPIALAYCLSLLNSFIQNKKNYSITPPWVLKNFPDVERIMFHLRNKPCLRGCSYCNTVLDVNKALKRFFGYNAYRSYGGEPLQEKAVAAAVNQKSLLAIFPTGGGKSITFQVPALLCGETTRALTIVISPLQSLMKDQVDNLERFGITEAVTINGLLDPIERAKSFERVEDGSASLLYLSPESLRSKTIEKLILGRKISRFVIDEAHCFSSWGQDFRVDYLYIGDFIKSIQEKKNISESIPVSCFTATAKQKVIEDIRDYFRQKLALNLEVFTSVANRTNLEYKVVEKLDDEQKYVTTRELIEEKNCPTIIYVSRTRKAYALAKRLNEDGFKAMAYHGKMEKKEKSENQDAFIRGETQIMVATSAFGMGVDKKDVGMVIHYEISDSLENYIQEAGRAGRDENITASCYVLFNEEDLSKHFILLNQSKLSIKEIQQIWKAIKDITKFRSTVSNSALEIARKAGWDHNVVEIETRVTTAIAALEDAGYLKRGQNMPRIFANSILAKNAQEAIDKINESKKIQQSQKVKAVRIIKKLFSSKNRKHATDEVAESRVDYISDHLGIVKEEVINIVSVLREENILADAKDLTAFIKKDENKNRSLQIVDTYSKVELFTFPLLEQQEKIISIKELNERAEVEGIFACSNTTIKTIINFWAIKNWIKRKILDSKNHLAIILLHPKELLKEKITKRHALAKFIIRYLFEKCKSINSEDKKEEYLVEFSVHELKAAYEQETSLFKNTVQLDDIEDTLFYLSKIEALKIEGGFLVVYNRLTIERTEQDNKKRYTKEDYQKLNQFYENKIQQIHIVGEYAKKMIDDYKNALQFVDDYFHLNYPLFLQRYFRGSRQQEISQNITPSKFKQLFGELSPAQLKIIRDNESKYMVVAAGPGSGKTKVLVHKLASLLLMEDVKHEQLLMLTFSRAAASEFKKRLLTLIGNAANYIDIKTFHSYCFDLLGRMGSLEKADEIIKSTIHKIKHKEVETMGITKTVLVIDEAQDMSKDEYELVCTLIEHNEEMRVIAVGDDDQNIYEFRGSSSKYLEQFLHLNKAIKHELIENYRSKRNIVDLSNQFAKQFVYRLKQTPCIPHQTENGRIAIIQHTSPNLVTGVVNHILSSRLSGTTCILTKTNDDALQITGLLLRNNIPAKLIQSNDGFRLHQLEEVHYFFNLVSGTENSHTISDEVWAKAKKSVIENFSESNKLEIIVNLIREFETTNPRTKYKSDLDVFIRESKLEDFVQHSTETIMVSTIHKAKGKEFNNVFLVLDNQIPKTEEAKRLLYVGMTRAITNLFIHVHSNFLNFLHSDNLEKIIDRNDYPIPQEISMHLSFKDVWLGYFKSRQSLLSRIKSGDKLTIQGNEGLAIESKSILKFSKQFQKKLAILEDKGYRINKATVNFLVYWKSEEDDQEIKIILPELYLKKC